MAERIRAASSASKFSITSFAWLSSSSARASGRVFRVHVGDHAKLFFKGERFHKLRTVGRVNEVVIQIFGIAGIKIDNFSVFVEIGNVVLFLFGNGLRFFLLFFFGFLCLGLKFEFFCLLGTMCIQYAIFIILWHTYLLTRQKRNYLTLKLKRRILNNQYHMQVCFCLSLKQNWGKFEFWK